MLFSDRLPQFLLGITSGSERLCFVPAWPAQLSRSMRLEEGMDLAHSQRNPLFRLFPGENAHFGFRCEHRALHGDVVRVRRNIVRQNQDGVLATSYEIPCHGEDEV